MAHSHPYHFAHSLVPQLAWRRPAAVRRELADPLLAHELLHYLWEKATEGLPAAAHVPPRGLHLSWHEVAGRALALLHLPAPHSSGEAHLAALVYEEVLDALDIDDDELAPRYFLLEAALGRSTDEGTPTLLGERAGDTHRHLGRGPAGGRAGTAAAFLAAVAAALGPLPLVVPFMRIVR